MCQACFEISCVGVAGCVNDGADPALAAAPGAEVRDYTALLKYLESEEARFNAAMPTVGAQVFVTYSFTETAAVPTTTDYAPYDATAYWAFDATQRENTRLAMAELSRVSGVIFVETTGEEAMLQVFGASGSSWGGWASYPWVSSHGTNTGRMVIDQDGTFAPGTNAFQVILHELGHAVGLKHPFQGDLTLVDDLDNTSQTLMSYSWSGGARSVFSPLDVQALEHIYGAARANTGWTWGMSGTVFALTAANTADIIIGVRTDNRLSGLGGRDMILGSGMNDTLFGGAGNDSLSGGNGSNQMFGGLGRDVITGGQGAELVRGGDDNDQITGDSGNDTLWGDSGNDRIWGDLATEGWGQDRINGGEGNDTIFGGGDSDRIWGEAGDDRIWGDFSADGWGQDTIYGGDGNDWIHGGDGGNVLYGGDGDDTLLGGDSGHMKLFGGKGDDVIHGSAPGATFAGWDTISGGEGNDRVTAGAGSDSVTGGAGRDTLFGGAGNDKLDGGLGNDILLGEADNDELFGGVGNDTLSGGDGFDELWGGAGRDRLTGGAGIDYFRFVAADFGTTDLITDFERDVDGIVLSGLGFVRTSLQITDHANGTDSLITVGPAGELTIQILGIRAADFDQYDIFF